MSISQYTPAQLQVLQRVFDCWQQALQVLKINLPIPDVLFKQRGRIAGSARLQEHSVNFNKVLLEDNLDAFLKEVIPHELCHLLTYKLHGRVRPHGREWQGMMWHIFGLQGQTTHAMDTKKVEGKKFRYHCACDQIELSIRRHNKVLRGEASYRCKRCGEILRPVV